jgi:nitrous oxidase accessory protein NosD
MCSLASLIKIVGILAPSSALIVCTGNLDGGTNGPASGRASPPLGAAKERLTGGGWKVIGAGDFNYDGMADVLWNDPGKNTMAVWLMRGTQLLTPGPVIPGPSGAGWSALTPADFNADGMADVPWSNSGEGTMATWLMAGTKLLLPGAVIPGPSGDGWSAVTAADFNFDGSADMLWHNAGKHTTAVWLMAGSKLLLPGPTLPAPSGDGWIVVTAADFNFDGMADVLWNNPGTNQMAVWLMRGTQLLLPGPVIPGPSGADWSAVAGADFNYDGMADVLWSNSGSGSMAVWLMRGTQLLMPGPEIPGPSGAGWSVVYDADFNFDGMADVIWQNTDTNRMAVWLMNGTQLLLPGPEIPGPADAGP